MAFDESGYLWIATPEGLSRYDSYSFDNYNPTTDIGHGLPGVNYVGFEHGTVIALSSSAVCRYDKDTDSFASYELPDRSNTIRTFASMSDSALVLGTDHGLYVFNEPSGTFRHVLPHLDYPVNDLAVLDDILYVATARHGVARVTKDGKVSYLKLLPGSDVNTLLVDGRSLLIGVEGHGLYRYRPSDGVVSPYPGIPGNTHVRALALDEKKNLWVGTLEGLFVVDGANGAIYEATVGAEGLSHSSVRAICADDQGGVWLGTYFGGINYYNPLLNQIRTLNKTGKEGKSLNDNIIADMTEDSSHRVWIGTNSGGVNVYDPASETVRYYTVADGLGSNDVKAIFLDEAAGKAYIGTHIGAMTILDLKSGKMCSAGVPSRNVFAILPTLDGRLWLDAFNCLFLFDPHTGTVSEPMPIEMGGCRLERSTGLFRDSENRLWVYGIDGMATFEENDGKLTATRVLRDSVAADMPGIEDVFEDTKGRFWISANSGLWAFDGEGNKLFYLTDADGLPSHIVNTTAEDSTGKIWVCTNRGVVTLDGDTGEVGKDVSFGSWGENVFAVKSILNVSGGRMMFGGIDGMRILNPSVFETNPYSPTPKITGLRLFDKAVKTGDETGILTQSIETTENISFGSDQTTFTIEFTVCNYPSGGENTFYYKLDGLDKNYIALPSGGNSVTYSNLPAGTYKFMLKASNNDGVQSEGIASIGITIEPVWYRTWWAILLWIVLATGAIGYVLRTVWHRKMMMARMKMQQTDVDRQHKIEEMKVRFFINMSHELRTPLTLMLLPIDELLARKNDVLTTEKLNTVKNNTMRILHIVNQLLDYRRAEMGMFKLKVRKVDVNLLAKQIFSSYETMARHRNIEYNFDSTLEEPLQTLDSDYFELIVNNLLTNAFKYTPKGQAVTLQLSGEDGNLAIVVKDTGCGIPADKLDKIFTRFYQVNDASSGNGIGLSLVKRLVELHHGSISVKSTLGEGSTFIVTLPRGEGNYAPDELVADSETTSVDSQPFIHIPDEDIAIEKENMKEDPDSSKPTIMVVDDNSEILKYLGNTLQPDYNVVLAANGAKAIELLTTEKIDLILTDVMMPDVDGVQLCRAVKRNLRTSHIPVIMLSAKSDLANQMDGMNVGADDYIAKPFPLDLLKAKIRNQLRTRMRLIDTYAHSTVIEPTKVAINPLDEEFLTKAVKVMDEHIDDSEFSTDAFAREMCMSRSNLHLKMKALTGEATNEFIRRVRLNKALELLKTSRYTVSEVSAMVGFGTPSYFATSFKKFFGYSPSELVKKD